MNQSLDAHCGMRHAIFGQMPLRTGERPFGAIVKQDNRAERGSQRLAMMASLQKGLCDSPQRRFNHAAKRGEIVFDHFPDEFVINFEVVMGENISEPNRLLPNWIRRP